MLGIEGVDKLPLRLASQKLLVRLVAIARPVNIADGHDLDIVVLQEFRQIHRTLITAADDRQVDPIAGSVLSKD